MGCKVAPPGNRVPAPAFFAFCCTAPDSPGRGARAPLALADGTQLPTSTHGCAAVTDYTTTIFPNTPMGGARRFLSRRRHLSVDQCHHAWSDRRDVNEAEPASAVIVCPRLAHTEWMPGAHFKNTKWPV